MGVVQQFNATIWCWAEMFRALRKRVAMTPFLIYAGVQVLLLLMVLGFTLPVLRSFVPGLLEWRFGEQALHYPNTLLALRGALGQADLVLSVLLGAFVMAAAARLFSSYYSGERARASSGYAAARANYLPALAITLIVAVVSQLLVRAPMAAWGDLADSSPMRFRLLRAALIGAVIVVQTLFVYAIAALVIDGKKLGEAMGTTLSLAFRNPVTSLLIVGVPAALELLPAWIMRNSPVFIYRFTPEFLAAGMVLWIIVILLIGYATAGAATRFYLHATANEAPQPGRKGGER